MMIGLQQGRQLMIAIGTVLGHRTLQNQPRERRGILVMVFV
jgi:hypothetical protein